MKFIDILFISLIVAIEPIHAARKSLNFLMVGDWGWNSENQSAVAYQMGVYGWRVSIFYSCCFIYLFLIR